MWFNSRYWLHCQSFLLEFKGLNLRWQFSGDIIWKNMNKLISSKYLVAQFLWTNFFLSCWTNDVTKFLKVMKLLSAPNCHLGFSTSVLETIKLEWQCSQYLELNRACVTNCFIYAWDHFYPFWLICESQSEKEVCLLGLKLVYFLCVIILGICLWQLYVWVQKRHAL